MYKSFLQLIHAELAKNVIKSVYSVTLRNGSYYWNQAVKEKLKSWIVDHTKNNKTSTDIIYKRKEKIIIIEQLKLYRDSCHQTTTSGKLRKFVLQQNNINQTIYFNSVVKFTPKPSEGEELKQYTK